LKAIDAEMPSDEKFLIAVTVLTKRLGEPIPNYGFEKIAEKSEGASLLWGMTNRTRPKSFSLRLREGNRP